MVVRAGPGAGVDGHRARPELPRADPVAVATDEPQRVLAACDLQNAIFRLAHVAEWGLDQATVAERVDELERREPSVKPTGERSRNQETILGAEDEEGVRRGVQRILKHAGYQVLVAADPAQAIALVEDYPGPLDMLLTDVVMPGINGKKLADEVTSRWPRTSVLFVSGFSQDNIVHDGRLDPGAKLLTKPFRKGDLALAVRNALDAAAGAVRPAPAR